MVWADGVHQLHSDDQGVFSHTAFVRGACRRRHFTLTVTHMPASPGFYPVPNPDNISLTHQAMKRLHMAGPVLTTSDSSMKHTILPTPHPNRTPNSGRSTGPVFAWKQISLQNYTSIKDSSNHPPVTQKPWMCPQFLLLSLPPTSGQQAPPPAFHLP